MTDKKRAKKSEVLRLAKALGVEVEEDLDSNGGSIYCDAPAGKVFAADPDLHGIVARYFTGDKPEAWADLLNRMSEGLEDCELEDCDVCEAVEKKAQVAEASADKLP